MSTVSRFVERVVSRTVSRTTGGGSGGLSVPFNTLYVLAMGQSNMTGLDTAGTKGSNSGITICNTTSGDLEAWDLTTDPPQHKIAGASPPLVNQDCPAYYFAQKMVAQYGVNVVTCFAALSGKAISFFTAPSGAIYLQVVTQLGTTFIDWVPRIDLVLWHQGESDAASGTYESDLNDVIVDIRALGTVPSDCPWIMGEIFDKAAYDAVNTDLADVAAADSNVYLTDSSDFTSVGDDIHFNSAGSDLMAARWVEKFALAKSVVLANSTGSVPAGSISDLAATQGGANSVDLAWTDLGSTETAYEIERESPIGGGFSVLTRVAGTATTYEDTGLTASTEYNYRIKPLNAYGYGATSNADDDTTISGIGFDKTGLIAWYDVETTDGGVNATVSDQHTNGLTLTTSDSPVGNATFGTHPSGLAAKTMDWNTPDYGYNASATWDITSGGITAGAWVYYDATANNDGIMGKWENGSDISWYLSTNGSGFPMFTISSDGSTLTSQPVGSTKPTSAWHFVVGRWNPSTRTSIFVDAVEEGADTTGQPATIDDGTGSNFFLAAYYQGSVAMSGGLLSAFVFNRVLSDSEITTLYASGAGVRYADL